MSEQETPDNTDKQDVRLNNALDRLEKKTTDRSSVDKQPVTSPLGILAIFLALSAIGIGSYATFMFYNLETSDGADVFAAQLAEVRRELQGSTDGLGSVSNQLDALLEKQSAALASVQANLESRIANLESSSGTTSQDWIIAEVEYLLRMANQRILMEQDPKGALALFKAADAIVADAQGLTAFSLREAMAADIARLEAVKMLDKEGLYLRLSAFVGQVGELKQRELLYSPPVEEDAPVSLQELSIVDRITSFIAKAGNRIASLIDYRRNEVEITPILPPEEEYYLRQNLMLKLQMAQIALLDRNSEIFVVSLMESVSWINKYFDPSDAATIAMRSGLEELLAIDVQQDMPDVTASLEEVRLLLGEFQQVENRP